MSESILNALVHLFAIITNFTDSRVSSKAREIVHSYLKKQLSVSQAIEYLNVFDNYLKFYDSDNTKVDSEKGRKRGALSAVKVLKICQQINENLHQREKFIVILRLIEFVNEDDIITDTELDFVSTVAESFNIPENEFSQIKALITNDVEDVEEKDRILIIDKQSHIESDGEWFDKNMPDQIKKTKHIVNENLDGRIIVLNIQSSDLYFFAYFGKSILYLQGHNVIPSTGYILDHGSIIKGPKISPLYYSDIVAKFLVSPTRDKIVFTADNISFHFKNSKNGIQDFSFTEESGNLIGIMGGSGVGKSTLLNVLNGKLPLSKGNITINGYDIHKEKEYLEGVIGYVPQDDLLIEELTVYQNLYYNAKLCFSNFNEYEIKEAVEKVLIDLDLQSIKDLKVGNPLAKFISGGQRKRLNIGLELIREPSILFVDEPTSGLSSNDSEMVMLLLRQQASKGKLVIANIHQPSSDIYKLLDKLWVVDKHGYIIYSGNPIDAVVYFKEITEHVNAQESECLTCGNVNSEQILEIVESKVVDEYGRFTRNRKRTPEDWYKIFNEKKSDLKLKKEKEKLPSNFFKVPSIEKQFQIFTIRNVLSKLTNKQYLLINLLEAPLLAIILAFFTKYLINGEYIFAENKNLPVYLFMCIVVFIFVGLTVSAQEIIRDRHILERESFLNLSHFSFINSKIVVLFLMSSIQVITFVLIGNWILEIKGMTFSYWFLLFTTAAFANLLGLNISSAFSSIVNIYILIPFILVPQLLLGGAMVNFDDLYTGITSKKHVPIIGDLMVSRWAYEALAVDQFSNNRFEREFFEEEKEKSRQQFKSAFLISELSNKVTRCELELKSDKTSKSFDAEMKLLGRELQKLSRDPAVKKIKTPNFARLNANAGLKEVNSINEYLDTLKATFSKLAAKAGSERDKKYKQMVAEMGSDEVYELQQNYYNKSLANIVMNKMQLKKLIEIDGELVPKKDPIFMKPTSNYGRAQFYTSEKMLFGYTINTYWFNTLVIWLGTFIMYIALLGDWLKKLFAYFENIKLRKKSKEQ